MSKFFSDTRVAFSAGPATDPLATDLEAAIGSLRQAAWTDESNGRANENETAKLVMPLDQTDHFSADLAASRLANCRTIRLPRWEEKRFVATEYNRKTHAAVEAYRTLRTRLDKLQTKGGIRALVITSAGQGEGKSLTALNLALCYAKIQNFPLLVVDADLRSRGLSRLLGNPESPGLAGILVDECEYSDAILGTGHAGLYTLPAGSSSTSPPELFAHSSWKEFIAWATETFRLVIVDCSPILGIADFELVLAPCDSAILVVRSRKTALADLSEALAQIDSKKMAGVVFNATEEAIKGYYPA